MKKFSVLITLLVLASLLLSGCAKPTQAPTAAPTAPAASGSEATAIPADRVGSKEIILATTTSTRDSGLLDVLLPVFEKSSGYTVKMIAVGTGQALKMGEEGNADVLLVHAPKSEKEFMANGFGLERLLVMHNDYIIVGPATDPAGIKGTATAPEALKKIAEAKATFVSRGDDSGTNKAELTLWTMAETDPAGQAWYLETGQGMGDTLRVTSEKAGYTMTDRATYLAQKANLSLDIMVEGDASLLNIYSVITVNPAKWPLVNLDAAKAFAAFMVAPDTQKLIGEFGIEKYGQALFFPDAGKDEATLGK